MTQVEISVPEVVEWLMTHVGTPKVRATRFLGEGLELGVLSIRDTPVMALFYSGYGNYTSMRRNGLVLIFDQVLTYPDITVSAQNNSNLMFSTVLGGNADQSLVKEKLGRLMGFYRIVVR